MRVFDGKSIEERIIARRAILFCVSLSATFHMGLSRFDRFVTGYVRTRGAALAHAEVGRGGVHADRLISTMDDFISAYTLLRTDGGSEHLARFAQVNFEPLPLFGVGRWLVRRSLAQRPSGSCRISEDAAVRLLWAYNSV